MALYHLGRDGWLTGFSVILERIARTSRADSTSPNISRLRKVLPSQISHQASTITSHLDTITSHLDTISQLKREVSQWREQARNWQDHFLRVEQERCVLQSSRIDELLQGTGESRSMRKVLPLPFEVRSSSPPISNMHSLLLHSAPTPSPHRP